MALFSDLIELSCHMNTDAWPRLSDSTLYLTFGGQRHLGITFGYEEIFLRALTIFNSKNANRAMQTMVGPGGVSYAYEASRPK